MKIRPRLNILILVTALVPASIFAGFSLYNYFSSTQKYLMEGYNEIKSMGEIELSENAWTEIEKKIRSLPPKVELLVLYGDKIITSSIPGFKAGNRLKYGVLFDFIRETNHEYDYQFQQPFMNDDFPHPLGEFERPPEKHRKNPWKNSRIVFLSRVKVSDSGREEDLSFFRFLFFLGLFEIGAAIVIFRVARALTSSIMFVEKQTQKIASGKIDEKISMEKLRHPADEILNLAENIEKMRKTLQENENRKSKFIMGISHDLRTPVAIIKGYTEALSDGLIEDENARKKSLGIIYEKSSVLESLIDDLINYVKLNSADWLQTLEKSELKTVFEETAGELVKTSNFYKRTASAECTLDSGIKVNIDKVMFTRVLENLFSNAVRYSKEGDSIVFKAWNDETNAFISISDTGIGIDSENLPHIFDLFYRGSASRRENGHGIGLSVVKTVADTMGWKIDVTSKKGSGTTFTITIPYNADKNP